MPVAPGTAGTLAALPLYLLLAATTGPIGYVAATLAVLVLGIPSAGRLSRTLGRSDPPQVVIDECLGFLVTMTLVEPTFRAILLGLLAFRALDVMKPFGIARLENMPGGYGIMLDDFAAGVMANLLVRFSLAILGPNP